MKAPLTDPNPNRGLPRSLVMPFVARSAGSSTATSRPWCAVRRRQSQSATSASRGCARTCARSPTNHLDPASAESLRAGLARSRRLLSPRVWLSGRERGWLGAGADFGLALRAFIVRSALGVKLIELTVDVVLRGTERGQVLEGAGFLQLADGRGPRLHLV